MSPASYLNTALSIIYPVILMPLQRLSPHQLQLPALAWALALLYSLGGGGLARGGELCPVTVTGNIMVTM